VELYACFRKLKAASAEGQNAKCGAWSVRPRYVAFANADRTSELPFGSLFHGLRNGVSRHLMYCWVPLHSKSRHRRGFYRYFCPHTQRHHLLAKTHHPPTKSRRPQNLSLTSSLGNPSPQPWAYRLFFQLTLFLNLTLILSRKQVLSFPLVILIIFFVPRAPILKQPHRSNTKLITIISAMLSSSRQSAVFTIPDS
jgi:hypothetical protein